MGLTDALGDAWNNTVDAVTNPIDTFQNVAQEAWEFQGNFVDNVSETIDAPRLVDAIKNGSPKEVFDWGKENANGGIVPLVIDGVFGTNVYDVTSSFTKNLGDTLIDDMGNGLISAAGLAQTGLEKIHAMPDLPQIDQALPQLDLYEDPDFENASMAETIAGRAGQVTGYAVPGVGFAGALLKGGKAAIGAYQVGRLISSLTDSLPAWMKPGSRVADDAGDAAPNAVPNAVKPAEASVHPKPLEPGEPGPWPAQPGEGRHARPDNFFLEEGQVYFDNSVRREAQDFVRVERYKNPHVIDEPPLPVEPGVSLRTGKPIDEPHVPQHRLDEGMIGPGNPGYVYAERGSYGGPPFFVREELGWGAMAIRPRV